MHRASLAQERRGRGCGVLVLIQEMGSDVKGVLESTWDYLRAPRECAEYPSPSFGSFSPMFEVSRYTGHQELGLLGVGVRNPSDELLGFLSFENQDFSSMPLDEHLSIFAHPKRKWFCSELFMFITLGHRAGPFPL